ncbi:MAG: hypothetical protein K8R92_01615 [Planctomycetes bacterium]|nr:hypothetical protein [Planctomycetota bacterium]
MLVRTLKSPWLMFVITGMLFVAGAHAEIGDFDTPLPINSNDLARLMKAAGMPLQERPQVEAAFDNYVDGWQKLRDQTLRPLSVRVAQLKRQQMWPVDDDPSNTRSREQEAKHWAEVEAEHEAILKSTAKTEAELCLKMAAAYKQIARLESPLFEVLRAGERTPAQLAALDREVLRRSRLRSGLILQYCNGINYGRPICAEILSLPTRGLDAGAIAKIAELQLAYERQVTPLLEQIAAKALSESADRDQPSVVSKEYVNFAQMQMKAINGIAAIMPKDVADTWLPKARARAIYTVLGFSPMPSRVDVIQRIGERANPKVLNRLAQWEHDRATLEDQALGALGSEPLEEARPRRRQLDETALEELAQLSDTPSLKELAYTYRSDAINDPEVANDFVGSAGNRQQDRDGAKRGALLAERQVNEDAPPQETEQQHSERRVLVRTLSAADLQRIHDRLSVAPGRRAVWEALAEDLLADTRAYAEQFQRGYDNRDHKPDAPRVLVIIPLAHEQRMQQSRREEQWFDDLATTMPELPVNSLAVERARRACARERAMAGSTLHRTQGQGNRWLDVDLDQAIESLKRLLTGESPAAMRETLAAWRTQKLLDIQALVLLNETHMVSREEGWRKLRNVPYDPANPLVVKQQEAEADYVRNNNVLCKRAADVQEGFIQALSSALTPDQAGMLRVVLRRQMYPEVYLSLERTDQEIDHARAGKDLSLEQSAALSSLTESFHHRFEQIADRAIKELDTCEQLWKDPDVNKGQTLNYPPWNEVRLALQFAELNNSDLQYDREELVAQTLRRMSAIGVTGSTE